jgi:uncharacterized protein (TIGR03435 family)
MSTESAGPDQRKQRSLAARTGMRVALAAALLITVLLGPTRAPAQGPNRSTPVATAGFTVASVRLCKDNVPFEARTGGGVTSPETLDINCQTLKGLIQMAYISFAGGIRLTPDRIEVEGGPKWINSERYNIKAKAEGVSSQVMMRGPMLRLLLEDRFKVRVHHETREVPVYILSVAKGGPKLQPFKEGTCTPYDITATFPPPPPPDNPCRLRTSTTEGVLTIDTEGTTLDDFARFTLGGGMDRPVINNTGIPGKFNFHLEYTPDQTSSPERPVAATAEQSGPSIFRAVQQLGLKLEPGRGPPDHLVIDRAEKPSEN